jgi:hypothetical protein
LPVLDAAAPVVDPTGLVLNTVAAVPDSIGLVFEAVGPVVGAGAAIVGDVLAAIAGGAGPGPRSCDAWQRGRATRARPRRGRASPLLEEFGGRTSAGRSRVTGHRSAG